MIVSIHSSCISEKDALEIWGVGKRTVIRWVKGEMPVHPWMVERLKSYTIEHYFRSYDMTAFFPYEKLDNEIYIMIKHPAPNDNADYLVSLMYENINKIETIILFSSYITHQRNSISFGFLLKVRERSVCCYYLQDRSGMTAERGSRKSEIVQVINHIALNYLMDKTYFVSKKLENSLSQESVPDIVKEVLHKYLLPFNLDNLVLYMGIMRGYEGFFDPSRYLIDDGVSTLKYVIRQTDCNIIDSNDYFTEILLEPLSNKNIDFLVEKIKDLLLKNMQHKSEAKEGKEDSISVRYTRSPEIKLFFCEKEQKSTLD